MATEQHPSRIGAIAWVVYDFGYSLFAFVIFARYLADWLISDLGRPDYYYTSAQVLTAASLVLLMPLAGVFADTIGRHLPLLAFFTALACVSGIGIGLVPVDSALGIGPLILLGSVCAAATGLAFAQYDPLLGAVAARARWGVWSGIAVAVGYLAVVVWLVFLAVPIVGEGDKQQAFVPAAIIFALTALPALLLIREPRHGRGEHAASSFGSVWSTTRMRMRGLLGRLRAERPVVRLLAGRFLYTDAIGTVNIYAVVYVSRLGGFSERDKDVIILAVVACAGAGALLAGWLARHIGPRRSLLSMLPLFSIGMFVVAASGSPWTVWLLAPVVGLSLGTVYAVDRVFMLALTPPALRGEFFGFFNLIGRVAQAVGPFILWGGVIFVLHDATGWLSALDASRVSLALLGVSVIAGLWVIWPLDDRARHDLT